MHRGTIAMLLGGIALVLAATLGMMSASTAPLTAGGPSVFGLVMPVHGGAAGNGGDASDTTFSFAASNATMPLVHTSGSPIISGEVAGIYGSADGMKVYDGGIDVAASDYQGFAGPKAPLGMDLSAAAGWPNIAVPAGSLAIDPALGRFKFHDGGTPALVGSWDPAGTHGSSGVAVQGNYAYLADWVRGLDIIDISNPASPIWRGNWTPTPSGWAEGMDVVVDGSYAYTTMKSKGLYILNIANPAAPTFVANRAASATEPDLALHLYKAGNYVYVASEKFGVLIYNVSTPSNPVKVGTLPISYAESIWIDGNRAYVAGGNLGLYIYDVTTPAHAVLLGSLSNVGYSYDVVAVGDYAFVTAGSAGLRVVNVHDPAHPSQITLAPTSAEAYDLRLANRCAYLAERGATGYLEVFDIRNPALPVLLKQYSSVRMNGVYPRGALAYVAAQSAGLLIINPNLSEAPLGAVTVDYNWDDPSVTATPTLTPTPIVTPDPSSTMTLTLQVTLQGRGAAPSPRWQVTLNVALTDPNDGPVRQAFTVTCDTSGRATIPGIPQGVYDVRVGRATSLVNVCRARSLAAGTHTLNMGELVEGDANQDGAINIFDFSLLASSYGQQSGDPGFDPRADSNGDGSINIFDFSLLASNYGLSGPRVVSGN